MQDISAGLANVRAPALARAEAAAARSQAPGDEASREAAAWREAAGAAGEGFYPRFVGTNPRLSLGSAFHDLESTCHQTQRVRFLKPD